MRVQTNMWKQAPLAPSPNPHRSCLAALNTPSYLATTQELGAVKAGLTRFTCTQHFEDPNDGTSDVTLLVANVPR